ncbi:MAG: CopG family transcriptional regulator [Spartobacteria bacterium]|nr:CopG family transcriptional regulator [Spartobacteria bacterium]
MRTIQMTLDDDLVSTVDRIVKTLHTTRSAFTREALRQAIKNMQSKKLEEMHRIGYTKKPVSAGEFDIWEPEQNWGNE